MSRPNDVDRLLHDWNEVASTAKPPAQDPRRDVRGTSALPVSLLLVAVVAIAGVAIVGRTAPLPATGHASLGASQAATGAPSAEPAATDPGVIVLVDTGEDHDGRFRLTLASDGTTFHEAETINAAATVEFLGPEGSLNARHGGTPVVFSVEEIGGSRGAGGANTDPCDGTTYQRGEPVAYPWTRSGAYSPDDPSPETQFVVEYLEGWPGASDGELRLPAGIWRLSATLDVMEEECATDAPSSNLSASVTLRVLPDSAAVSEPPVAASPVPPTPAPELSSLGVVDDGRFRVELTTSGTTFTEGETIRAGAEVAFLGPERSLRVGHGSPAISFRVDEVGGSRSVGGGVDAMCVITDFTRDEAVTYPWQRSGSYSPDDPSENDRFGKAYIDAWPGAQNGELRLPAGTWRLSADFDVHEGDCGEHDPRTASVVIRVESSTAEATPGPTPTPIPTPGPTDPDGNTTANAIRVGPVVRCEIDVRACETAVALARDVEPGAYAAAAVILVADTCTPGAVCDRQFAFDSVVLLVPEDGNPATSPAVSVQGVDGPMEAGVRPAFVPGWMSTLATEASALVAVPVQEARHISQFVRVCPTVAVEARLVPDDRWGVAIADREGEVTAVRWPFGFAARHDGDTLQLLEADGDVLAGTGDWVQIGGAPANGVLTACGGVAAVKP